MEPGDVLELITAKTGQPSQVLDLAGWLKELHRETDRGAAMVGAAMLDARLRLILWTFMVEDKKEVEALLGSERAPDRGPLANFSARIRACFSLGLIPSDMRDDLRSVGKIRNLFAHELHGLTFDTREIEAECRKLKTPDRLGPRHYQPRSTRSDFIATVAINGVLLMNCISHPADRRKVRPAFVFQVATGDEGSTLSDGRQTEPEPGAE